MQVLSRICGSGREVLGGVGVHTIAGWFVCIWSWWLDYTSSGFGEVIDGAQSNLQVIVVASWCIDGVSADYMLFAKGSR